LAVGGFSECVGDAIVEIVEDFLVPIVDCPVQIGEVASDSDGDGFLPFKISQFSFFPGYLTVPNAIETLFGIVKIVK
jgi:hypothetical protein